MEIPAAQDPNMKRPSKHPSSRNRTSPPQTKKSRPDRRPKATSSPLPKSRTSQTWIKIFQIQKSSKLYESFSASNLPNLQFNFQVPIFSFHASSCFFASLRFFASSYVFKKCNSLLITLLDVYFLLKRLTVGFFHAYIHTTRKKAYRWLFKSYKACR